MTKKQRENIHRNETMIHRQTGWHTEKADTQNQTGRHVEKEKQRQRQTGGVVRRKYEIGTDRKQKNVDKVRQREQETRRQTDGKTGKRDKNRDKY